MKKFCKKFFFNIEQESKALLHWIVGFLYPKELNGIFLRFITSELIATLKMGLIYGGMLFAYVIDVSFPDKEVVNLASQLRANA